MRFTLTIMFVIVAANVVQPFRAVTPLTVIRAGSLWTGDRVLKNATVVISGDRILSVSTGKVAAASGAKEIDLRTYFVIPGLIDLHTHITYSWDGAPGTTPLKQGPRRTPEETARAAANNALRTLATGVTTIRDLGASGGADYLVRDRIASGAMIGPRAFVAGQGISAARGGGPAPEAMREQVETRVKAGSDWIKVYASRGSFQSVETTQTLTFEQMKAIVDAAHALGRKVAIHSYGASGVRDAVRAGADSVEHGIELDDATLREMVKRRTVWVPTIDHNRYYVDAKDEYGFAPESIPPLQDYIQKNLDATRRAFKAGVRLGMGSDAVYTMFGQNTRELAWFVKAGMTPEQALHTATTIPADLLGMRGSLGRIAKGYLADLVAIEGDPLRDIGRVIEGVRWVMKDGAVLIHEPPPPQSMPATLTTEVDPFIGTGGHGHTYPGPSLPFGMIQPGPDTRLTGWDGCSGYHYSDSRIFGFSHTHLSGTGIPDYADILLMPTTGDLRLNNGADGQPGYSSAFTHDQEAASPGYYAVTLKDHGVRAELTTTLRVGMHRYTFPVGKPAHVILDLAHRDAVKEASFEVIGDREVAGVRRSTGWARDQVVYFVIRFSRPFQPIGHSGGPQTPVQGFDFGATGEPVLVKVAISAVSVDGARRNLDAELPGWDFDGTRAAAQQAWEKELSKIRVDGGTRDQRVTFYTALYHSMLTPNVFMDVDGQYRGRDFKLHKAEGFTYYTVFSLWDTFRALHPLLAIVDRARTRDFVRTFLAQYEQGGRLPVWELAANETDTMIGYHAVPVIADAIAKDIPGFDRELAFRAMRHSAEEDRFGLAAYKRNGFIDGSDEAESVSRTLEYAYDDWTIAQVAQRLGHGEDYAEYMRRAQSYKHLFDPSTGFMRARVEGVWASPFDPSEVNNHYTEANAWQYSFFVPHDVGGLARLMGGREAFVRKLDALFSASQKTTGREQADITGLIGQYAHGNEPSHHMAYLYALAGQPWKTQAMVRRILDELYHPAPDGLSGNEDCGQMSAWYVLSALGFYPVAPGSNEYVIGSPLFEKAVIRLENGKAFVVRRQGASTAAMYIHSATLAGKPLARPLLEHAALAKGGELDFQMRDTPNPGWAVLPAAGEPHGPSTVVAAPFVAAGARTFRGTQDVTLGDAEAGVEIRYTLDGTTPARLSGKYERPIAVSSSATLKAIAFRGDAASPVMSVTFRRLSDFPRITLSAAYAPQYAAAGEDALIDGLRGNDSFRTGRWQGYLGRDLVVTLDYGAPRDIREVAMGFLQDTGSWIFMPRRVSIETSDDGVSFAPFGVVENDVPERESKAVTRDFVFDAPSARRARYVRVRVEHYGKLPGWHPGAGQDAWFFADEIIVR